MTTKIPVELSSTPSIVDGGNATAITIDSSERIGIGTSSPSDPLVVSDSGASSITARLINTNADANPANLRLQKLSGSPADGDYIGMINVSGENDASEETIFQSIDFISTDVSDGSEDGVIAFRTRGAGSLAERMRIDSSGNVGIGTTSPSIKLEAVTSHNPDGSGIYADAANQLHLKNTSTTDNASSGMIYSSGAGAGVLTSALFPNADTNREAHFIISTANSGGTLGERMRIDSSGNLLVGKTDTTFANAGFHTSVNGRTFITVASDEVLSLNRTGNAGLILRFFDDGSLVGSVSTNSNSLPSDRNFKKNIGDLDLGLNLVSKLKPSQYNYKIDDKNSPLMYGLIAQDLEESLTEVGVEKNSTWLLQHEPNNDEKQSDYSLDYLKLTPVLIKAIQEQQTIIEDLQTQINEVKNGN